MQQNSIDNAQAIALAIVEIQKRFRTLSPEEAGIVQLFFDAGLTVEQISQACEQSEDHIREVLLTFGAKVLDDNSQIQRRVFPFVILNPTSADGVRRRAASLFLGSQPTEGEGDLLRELIGMAIRITIPPEPQDLCARIIAAGTIQQLRSPVKLDERDFFLGTRRRAAGQGAEEQEADQAVRSASRGTVFLTRRSEEFDVGFTIAREEGKAATYTIVFKDLPNWAIPVEFGFTGPDRNGIPKDYSIKGAFERPQFQFDVGNDPEREVAFIERTNAYITFDCL
jgi:hypothetical protein